MSYLWLYRNFSLFIYFLPQSPNKTVLCELIRPYSGQRPLQSNRILKANLSLCIFQRPKINFTVIIFCKKTISDQHQQHHRTEKMCRKPFSSACIYCPTCYTTIFYDNSGNFVPSNNEKIRRELVLNTTNSLRITNWQHHK